MDASDVTFAALAAIYFAAALVFAAFAIQVWGDISAALDRKIDRRIDIRLEK